MIDGNGGNPIGSAVPTLSDGMVSIERRHCPSETPRQHLPPGGELRVDKLDLSIKR